MTKIKICGISSIETMNAAADAGADYIGLVHFEASPRHVSLEEAAKLRMHAPASLKIVLLLVNASPTITANALTIVKPDVLQFHGSETPEWIKLVKEKTKVEVWKAMGVRGQESLDNSAKYNDIVDRLLFDAPAKALPGGTGTSFDWSLLKSHKHAVDWGLAGGLDADNVANAITATAAPLVDTSSGVESAAGIKDVDKIAAFCKAVHSI